MNKENKKFIKQYLNTALWSSTTENGEYLDSIFGLSDIDFKSVKRSVKDCLKFIEMAENENLLDEYSYSTAGHDFWLTRNGHGGGFWDGDYKEIDGEKLTELSEKFNEVNCIDYIDHNDINKIEIY